MCRSIYDSVHGIILSAVIQARNRLNISQGYLDVLVRWLLRRRCLLTLTVYSYTHLSLCNPQSKSYSHSCSWQHLLPFQTKLSPSQGSPTTHLNKKLLLITCKTGHQEGALQRDKLKRLLPSSKLLFSTTDINSPSIIPATLHRQTKSNYQHRYTPILHQHGSALSTSYHG